MTATSALPAPAEIEADSVLRLIVCSDLANRKQLAEVRWHQLHGELGEHVQLWAVPGVDGAVRAEGVLSRVSLVFSRHGLLVGELTRRRARERRGNASPKEGPDG